MKDFNQKTRIILQLFLEHSVLHSSQVHDFLTQKNETTSLVTIKRELAKMVALKYIFAHGNGRARAYSISTLGRLFTPIDERVYCATEPDKRFGQTQFNFNLLSEVPQKIFSPREIETFKNATKEYRQHTSNISPAIEKQELERLIIELSWKSSKIEGNTYTLLDTERLIRENKQARGHDPKEAVMILNHKDAFMFVRNNAKLFQKLTRANLEQIHGLLIKKLDVKRGLRHTAVGVTGSTYRPLDNVYQITEALEQLSSATAHVQTPYAKALIALLGLSYIQPFEDGNKRTARMMANAILLAYRCAPLSYRSVDEQQYREATLVFYEINSLVPFKKIFIEQYLFAAKNYAVR